MKTPPWVALAALSLSASLLAVAAACDDKKASAPDGGDDAALAADDGGARADPPSSATVGDPPASAPPSTVIGPDGGVVAVSAAPVKEVVPMLDIAAIEQAVASGCGPSCECVKQRFADAHPVPGPMKKLDVELDLKDAQAWCSARPPDLREGVIATCMNEKETQRDTCTCAADAFLRNSTNERLIDIRQNGWKIDTTKALERERKGCAAKMKKSK